MQLPLLATIAAGGAPGYALQSPLVSSELRGCRARIDAEELLPPDALFVGFYDMERERRYAPKVEASKAVGPRALLPPEIEAVRIMWIGIAAGCELDDKFWGEAWVSVDREEEVLIALRGEGIGDEDNLRCIFQRVQRIPDLVDDGGVRIARDGCGVRIDYDDELSGIAPRDDLLVVGTAKAVDRARAVWNSRSPNPPERLLPPRRARSWLWAALDVPAIVETDEIAAGYADSGLGPLAGVRTVEFSAKLATRFGVELSGTFLTEGDARAAEAVVRALMISPPPAIPAWGRGLIDMLELSRKDKRVSIELPLKRKTAHELGMLPSRAESRLMPAFAWLSAALLL